MLRIARPRIMKLLRVCVLHNIRIHIYIDIFVCFQPQSAKAACSRKKRDSRVYNVEVLALTIKQKRKLKRKH